MTEQTAHEPLPEPLTPERARSARVIRKAIGENFNMTPLEESELATAVEKGLNDEQIHSGNGHDIQDRIYEDIYDALKTVEWWELPELIGAEAKLGGIAEAARALSASLNDLCSSRHWREQVGATS